MQRGDGGQPRGHRFEQGVRYAFLVAAGREFARMEENVRALVKAEELFLRTPSSQLHVGFQTQFGRQRADFVGERTIACQGQLCLWQFVHDLAQGAQSSENPLLCDQAAGLQQPPLAVCGWLAHQIWQVFQRDGGAVQPQLFRWAPERRELGQQRFAPAEDQPRVRKHLRES